MRRWRLAAGSLLLASTATACGLLLGIGDESFTGPNDAGAEATAPDAPPAAATCGHTGVPALSPDATAGSSNVPLPFALRTMRFAQTTAGYDLDGTCTCLPNDTAHGGAPSCVPPDAQAPCGYDAGVDYDGGIDDGFSSVIVKLDALGTTKIDQTFQDALDCGQQTIMFFLGGWNGTSEDNEVEIQTVVSTGIHQAQDGGAPGDASTCGSPTPDAAEPDFAATWNGNDVWFLAPNHVDRQGDAIVLHDDETLKGYVTGGKLVIDGRTQMDRPLLIALGASSTLMHVYGAVVVADITLGSAGWTLTNGTFAGRLPAVDFLTSLGSVPIAAFRSPENPQGYVCAADAGFAFLYPVVKGAVCEALDIRSKPSGDFTNSPCDAISFVMSFEAVQAIAGPDDPNGNQADSGCQLTFHDDCVGDAGDAD